MQMCRTQAAGFLATCAPAMPTTRRGHHLGRPGQQRRGHEELQRALCATRQKSPHAAAVFAWKLGEHDCLVIASLNGQEAQTRLSRSQPPAVQSADADTAIRCAPELLCAAASTLQRREAAAAFLHSALRPPDEACVAERCRPSGEVAVIAACVSERCLRRFSIAWACIFADGIGNGDARSAAAVRARARCGRAARALSCRRADC